MYPQDLLYTDQHEWIRVVGQNAIVGISEHAQKQLGDLTFVELPAVGKKLVKGSEACALESCKAAASVFAPASGTVTEVNQSLAGDPGLINRDCYGQGWIFKMKIDKPAEQTELMKSDAYAKFLGE